LVFVAIPVVTHDTCRPLTQIFETGQTIEVQGLAVDDDGAIFKGQGETENYVMSLFLNFTPSANIPSFTGCMLEMVTNTVRAVVMWCKRSLQALQMLCCGLAPRAE
jgi:hypothetical protein